MALFGNGNHTTYHLYQDGETADGLWHGFYQHHSTPSFLGTNFLWINVADPASSETSQMMIVVAGSRSIHGGFPSQPRLIAGGEELDAKVP